MPTNGELKRKLRMGLVGGGRGSFIGRVHATAGVLDNRARLVAGALSSDPERAVASAEDYDIAPGRAYRSYTELIETEARRPEDDRIDFVSIATPNHTHFAIAQSACRAGFDVICDKPLTLDLGQAEALAGIVEETGVVFALTHNYTGYPLVRQAREMAAAGELGEIVAVRATYFQGRRRPADEGGRRRFAWRCDPQRAGSAGAFADIGTHAYNLARYVSGLLPTEISCLLKIVEPDRTLDDYGHAVVRFENGALGTITVSQVSPGRENDLALEVDGTKLGLQWRQEQPNQLIVRATRQPHQIYYRDPGGPLSTGGHRAACRIPAGHPEGFLEGFANVYRDAFDAMVARKLGRKFETVDTIYPNVHDGVEGMFFLAQSLASSQAGGAWMQLRHPRARR